MVSSLGWIDFSSEARSRVEDVLALLSEPGTLDELGVGQIRDAFSDRLFPGFSTVQTSIKYLVMLPRIFRDWEDLARSNQASGTFEDYLRDSENSLARKLSANHGKAGLALDGIIGHTLVDKGGVVRRPSSVYWNGMRVFGLVRSDLSLAEFSQAWNTPLETQANTTAEDGEDDMVHRRQLIRVPRGHAAGWMDKAVLMLSEVEARFLMDRLCSAEANRESATVELLRQPDISEALKLAEFAALQDWASRSGLSAACRALMLQAWHFSLAVEGAHIRLNRLIAERIGSEKLKALTEREFGNWRAIAHSNGVFGEGGVEGWLAASGVGARIKPSTAIFLNRWNDAMWRGRPEAELDALIRDRAIANKPERSVLLKPPKSEPEWFGMRALEFRWATVRSMLRELSSVTGAGDAHRK